MTTQYEIEVHADAATGSRLVGDLESALKQSAPDVSTSRLKKSQDTMDLGTVISVVVGSSAATAVGQGVRLWLAKHNNGSISVTKDGNVVAKNLTSADVVRVAEIFAKE